MLIDIAKLRLELHEKVEALRTLQEEISNRADKKATDDEKLKSSALREEISNREEEIRNKEIIQQHELENQDNRDNNNDNGEEEYRNFGEWIAAAYEGRVQADKSEKRVMSMGNGISAGYLVPDQFGGMLKSFEPDAALVRPRCQYLGGGSDATISYNAFDQSGSKGVYGGVTVNWISEMGTKLNAGDLEYLQLKFEPKEVAGYIDVSNKLLRNAAEVSGYIQNQLQMAIQGSEDQKFVDGSGVGCPLGFIGHSSSIEITRNTASSVVYEDLKQMYARTRFSSNLVWVINQTVLPSLMDMEDTGGSLIWQPNARDGKPSTIFGIPVVYSDLLPVLGNKGDVCLCDFKYYGVRDGSAVSIFFEPFTQAVNQITRIYAYWNVDGQPMVTSPLLLRDGSNTVSPFIVLD